MNYCFRLLSVAHSVTRVGPRLTTVPGAGIWDNVTDPQLSAAWAPLLKSGRLACAFVFALIVSLVAHCTNVGGCVSMTVTVKLVVVWLLLVSVATIVTVVTPLENVEPLGV